MERGSLRGKRGDDDVDDISVNRAASPGTEVSVLSIVITRGDYWCLFFYGGRFKTALSRGCGASVTPQSSTKLTGRLSS